MKGRNEQCALGIVSGDDYLKHETGSGHPESPVRIEVLLNALASADFSYEALEAEPASINDIKLVHDFHYHDLVKIDVESFADKLRTGDTAISSDSYEVAMLASGAAITAVDAVMSGIVRRAFCMTRPPGHHATPDRGMGFCIFNHVAIAAKHALNFPGIERVAIIDWDVHHGNGTQDICIDDDRILFFSSHEADIYPHTGEPIDDPLTLNVELARGAGDDAILQVWGEVLEPAIERFQPDFILVSAGFDARVGDPIGGLNITDDGFAELTKRTVALAEKFSEGRLISILEGGYDPGGLAKAVMAHLGIMARL